MIVRDYLTFAGRLRGLDAAQVKKRLPEVEELTHLRDVDDEVVRNLSHGYRQRVGVAQAIIHEPRLVILDEPTRGLDPVQIVEMRALINGLKQRHTILISSHILPEISQTCDRIIVIRDGRIVATGREDELLSHLSSRQRVRLLVRGDKEPLQKLLKGIDGVVKVELQLVEPQRRDEASLIHHLKVETSKDLREALSREIVAAGFGLLQLTPAEPELESIFIQLTHPDGKGKEVLQ
jgi:ABC-2 type transport system ATP-binding protein